MSQVADSLKYLNGLYRFGIKLGLENIRTLLRGLGDPQNQFTGIIVSGTNGKGSVAAMIASMLSCSGIRTGLFTSPHLSRLNERFRVDGQQVSDDRLVRCTERVRSCISALRGGGFLKASPTFFEVVTAIAVEHFADIGVETAVFEVGLGGRFDATNALPAVLGVITSVDLDHMEFLGSTRALIAREKAGIIKEGGAAVTPSDLNPDALEVLRGIAGEKNALLREVDTDKGSNWNQGWDGSRFTAAVNGESNEYQLPLLGDHQVRNARLALAATEILEDLGLKLTDEGRHQGLATVQWPGRLECLERDPHVVLDGAHNPAAAQALAKFLSGSSFHCRRLLFGATKKKDIEGITGHLFPLFDEILLTRAKVPRALNPESIRLRCPHMKALRGIESDAQKGYLTLRKESEPGDLLCVSGSIFLVGEVREGILS